MNDRNYNPNQTYNYDPNRGPNQNPNYRPEAKSIATNIILSIITCGIYAFYWMYTLNEDMAVLVGRPPRMSGGMVILLSIVTCGIYEFIWMYNMGQDVDEIKNRLKIPSSNTSIVYLLLSIFGFSIVSLGLMQNEVNSVVTGRYGYYQ